MQTRDGASFSPVTSAISRPLVVSMTCALWASSMISARSPDAQTCGARAPYGPIRYRDASGLPTKPVAVIVVERGEAALGERERELRLRSLNGRRGRCCIDGGRDRCLDCDRRDRFGPSRHHEHSRGDRGHGDDAADERESGRIRRRIGDRRRAKLGELLFGLTKLRLELLFPVGVRARLDELFFERFLLHPKRIAFVAVIHA
jgi:hypothetical protein